jgi:hypothetical protein
MSRLVGDDVAIRHTRDLSSSAPVARDADNDGTMQRVNQKLLPLLVLIYIVSFFDRTNVGIAAMRTTPPAPESDDHVAREIDNANS